MITVVTGFREDGYKLYGRTFVESFHEHWPPAVRLWVYSWSNIKLPRGSIIPIPRDCVDFVNRHENNPIARGRKRISTMRWRVKEIENGYCYRFDAWKFCQMAFYARDAAHKIGEDIMVWSDADVETLADVPVNFVHNLLGGHDVAYLGRKPAHSETGFIAFKLPRAISVLDEWADFYATGDVFEMPEWHSAYLFDRARERHREIQCRDITPGGRGHVWFQSPLRLYMDHKKGDLRKLKGRSEQRR